MIKNKKLVSAILLGAGESKRMGNDKLKLPWGKKTVFERCLDVLLQSELGEVVVVLRVWTKEFEERIRRYPSFTRKKIKVVVNPEYQKGMSTSILRGLKYLYPDSEGILIALGDQPLLKPRTINALIHAFFHGVGKIVVPFYKGRRGNPILFDRRYIKDLMNLRGDMGGRLIIERHPDKVIRVRTRSGGVIKDIDTWEDYKKLKRKRQKAG